MFPPVASKSLRYRLFWLAAMATVPLVIVAMLGVAQIASERRAETRATAVDLSRVLMQAVDSELRRTIAVLDVLGQALELERGDLQAFHARCRLTVARQPFWEGVLLTDRGGKVLFDTRQPYSAGAAPSSHGDARSIERAIESGFPAVGRLQSEQGRWAFTVSVPVLSNGKVRYVLTAPLSPEAIHAVLARQEIPEEWTVAVYEHSGLRVARSRAHATAVGGRATPSLQSLMEGKRLEGSGVATNIEGHLVHTGYSRRSEFGWFVVVGLPDSNVRAAIYRQSLLHGLGLLASCLLCAYLAFIASRKITNPMSSLCRAAQALGRREPVPEFRSGVQEIDEVGVALMNASQEIESFDAQRGSLLQATAEALEKAKQAGRAKDEFLAILGHELRNPLAPIVTSLQVMELKGDKGTETQREVIRRQVTQMTRLVDDLLDVSRITTGRVELKKATIDLKVVTERAVEAVMPSQRGDGPQLFLWLDPSPTLVLGDEARLQQVVTNLLVNAVKFTPPGGRIEVAVQRMAEQVEIQVRDTGQGIPPDFLPRVFDLFSQAGPPGSRPAAGLGLGLAIVKNLVELHGGQVSVHSEGPGQGSCFRVRLPAGAKDPHPHAARAPAPHDRGEGRILLVDDNVDAAMSLATLLELQGYEVRAAHRPTAALGLLAEFAPDLAILDIGLPEMDGYELARRLQAHPEWPGGPLIALTGFGQAADRQRALEAGFSEHLAKPVDSNRLLSFLASIRSPACRPQGAT